MLEKIKKDFKEYPEIDSIIYDVEDTYTNWISKVILLFQVKKSKIYGNKKKIISLGSYFIISKKVFKNLGGIDDSVYYYDDRSFEEKFIEKKYKSLWDPNIKFYSAQPNTFKRFYRRYSWSGQGIRTVKDKKIKQRMIFYLFSKVIFIISPLMLSFFYPLYAFYLFLITFGVTYIYAIRTSKVILWTFLMVPLMWVKNLIEFYAFFFKKLNK